MGNDENGQDEEVGSSDGVQRGHSERRPVRSEGRAVTVEMSNALHPSSVLAEEDKGRS